MKSESIVAGLLLVFGFIGLPALIYLVGGEVIGPYEGERGIIGLFGALFASLGRGEIPTWVLVLSPFLTILLIRVMVWTHRSRKRVNRVTE